MNPKYFKPMFDQTLLNYGINRLKIGRTLTAFNSSHTKFVEIILVLVFLFHFLAILCLRRAVFSHDHRICDFCLEKQDKLVNGIKNLAVHSQPYSSL